MCSAYHDTYTRDGTAWLFSSRTARALLTKTGQRKGHMMRTPTREADISRVLDSALAHCRSTQRADGSWAALPDPRITETALTCHALADAEAERSVTRARAWLRTATAQAHHPAAHAIESTLQSIALGEAPTGDFSRADFSGPGLSSRAVLLRTICTVAGHPLPGSASATHLRAQLDGALNSRLKAWSRIELMSCAALLDAHLDRLRPARLLVRSLARQQAPDGSFYRNPLSTAVAFLALNTVAPRSPERNLARTHLLRSQRPDGTWRFCTTDVWDTTLTMRAFAGIPAFDADCVPRATAFLLNAQHADGGWPFRSGLESDNDTTSAALLALARAPSTHVADHAVTRALDHLAAEQTSDGLWRTWQSDGDPPVSDVVAHVVSALAACPGRHTVDTEPASRWLAGQWWERGEWRASWYRGQPYALLEVGAALSHTPLANLAAGALAALRNTDGGWSAEAGQESQASATGQALAVLGRSRIHDRFVWDGALDYLFRTQRPDGTWPGRPDMLGPRPLLSHYQTHTQAFTVMGLRAAPLGRPEHSTPGPTSALA